MRQFFKFLALPVALPVALAFGTAQAADYPSSPVTMVVPFGAGTSTDLVSRILGDAMSQDLGQPFVMENRPGAGGSIGTVEVVKADADGYKISMGTVGTLAINVSLYDNLPYDPQADLEPIALVGYTPTLLVVDSDSPYNSLDDLIAASKSGDGLTFASAGNGTSGHLAGELLGIESGGQMLHIPFNSGAEGLTAVMSGEVDFMFYHPVAALPNIDAGTLRAIGVSGADGSPVAPTVPAIADTYPDFNLVAWWLLAAPAGTPKPVLEKLYGAVQTGLADDAVVAHFEKNGIRPGKLKFDELPGFISAEIKKWGDIANAAKAQVD
ncbi:MAG TPA: hypothetical protein DFI00_09690 [Rhodospirillaceae bacterium]|nr:hypothetical protein [Alphaproteobacteria bacterium]MAS47795.1 hypothetical protein [Alphaproteobacteria bacterium]MAX96957.1 hypothetical protein [Alphaproteobacteria bacterium]OUT40220.1 MAG: hypothetical protein CBB62_10560 [Micavibrio sp. TMED2]HCI47554.1 hypothetical protein [Rhodospirillaceae bacterium]|tara:strand:+ start:823 stop:1794 length:972 start_codon:yes stop_codon:yes gene_type:complete